VVITAAAFSATAFTVTSQPIAGGSATILLGEDPVLVEEAAFVRLTPEGFLTNGQFHVRLTGTVGETCVIQVSSNLTAWTAMQTNSLTNGVWLFVDSTATNFNQRFYRAQLAP
jgi:hypothetical protein